MVFYRNLFFISNSSLYHVGWRLKVADENHDPVNKLLKKKKKINKEVLLIEFTRNRVFSESTHSGRKSTFKIWEFCCFYELQFGAISHAHYVTLHSLLNFQCSSVLVRVYWVRLVLKK